MPDELLERIDAAAHRVGRPWQRVFGEVLAHYAIREQDRKADETRRRMDAYKRQLGISN